MNLKTSYLLLILVTLFGVSMACKGGDEAQQATLEALAESVRKTATAAALEINRPSDDSAVATALAKATEQGLALAATQTAMAASSNQAQATQAEAERPVIAELPQYGIDPEKGELGWAHEPVTLEINGYQQHAFANDYGYITARDFVLGADITWDTQYGTSGCGFIFRSDGDQNRPSQYLVAISRGGTGYAVFLAMVQGDLANFKEFYIRGQDRSFGWKNGDTNHLVVVARGPIIEIYTNGVKIGEVDTRQPPQRPANPPKPQLPINQDDQQAMAVYQSQMQQYQEIIDKMQSNYNLAAMNFSPKEAVFEEGYLGMIAISESGYTRCDFNNAYLWLIHSD